jgi:ribonuclease HII
MSSKTFPSLSLEKELWSKGFRFVIGMDEVGRGAIAGPVAVGVAILDQNNLRTATPWPEKLCDSKLISEKVRNEIVDSVCEWVQGSAVGMVSASDIDANGIIHSLAKAGSIALDGILLENPTLREAIAKDGAVIILDGSHNWIGPMASGMDVLVKTKADRDCVSVAAASVIAKVARDNHMIGLSSEFAGYGFEGHKGYASASHIAAIQDSGPSQEHRVTWLTKILAGGAGSAAEMGPVDMSNSAQGSEE